ncbi:MAG: hypothetical protein D6751_11615 [Deltaproteobacteria bacterium]|nr:MAG: hypothetical protein D6751_11615 [Deltaproteobacteria bacterium]
MLLTGIVDQAGADLVRGGANISVQGDFYAPLLDLKGWKQLLDSRRERAGRTTVEKEWLHLTLGGQG